MKGTVDGLVQMELGKPVAYFSTISQQGPTEHGSTRVTELHMQDCSMHCMAYVMQPSLTSTSFLNLFSMIIMLNKVEVDWVALHKPFCTN